MAGWMAARLRLICMDAGSTSRTAWLPIGITGAGSSSLPTRAKSRQYSCFWRDYVARLFARDFQYGRENLQLALIELVPSCERNGIHKGSWPTIAILSREARRRWLFVVDLWQNTRTRMVSDVQPA